MTLVSPSALPDAPSVAVIERGVLLVRVYGPGRRWNERRSHGPLPDARFDHHRPPPGSDHERSVWYAARTVLGAVAETYGKRCVLDRAAGDRVVLARVAKQIRLVDLVGIAARRFGLTQEIGAATDYEKTQEWARALYERYDDLDGVRWRGRQAGSICLVLTDRAPMRSLAKEKDFAIGDPSVWPRIARAAQRCNVRII